MGPQRAGAKEHTKSDSPSLSVLQLAALGLRKAPEGAWRFRSVPEGWSRVEQSLNLKFEVWKTSCLYPLCDL